MKKLLLTSISFILVAAAAVAQNNGGQRRNFDPTEVHNRMAERLAKQMKLDEDKEGAFKVLYLDYQTARQNAVNPKSENEKDEKIDLKTVSDEKALELIQKQFAGQEAQLAVDKEYLPKFLEILTPAQTAQVYLRRAGAQRGQAGQRGQEGMGGGRPGGGFGGGFGGGPGGGFGGGF